jgi:hypothetical protein
LAAVRPAPSVAVHVTVVEANGNVEPDFGVQLTEAGPALSLAEALKVTTAGPVADTVMLAGTVTIGGVVSTTVIVNEAELLFLPESSAVHVIVWGPRVRIDPDEGEQMTGTLPSTRSVAVGPENVAVAPEALVASSVWFAGTFVIVGAPSVTVTVKELLPVRLSLSGSVVQLTVVVPTANVDPEAGTQLTAGGWASSSVTVTLKVTTAPLGPVAPVVIGLGTTTTGAAALAVEAK